MISPRTIWAVLALLLVSTVLLIFGSGCASSQPYNGPTISTVGVGGSYTDKEGQTYGGTVNLGLAYPSPAPTPVHSIKPVRRVADPSK